MLFKKQRSTALLLKFNEYLEAGDDTKVGVLIQKVLDVA